MKNNAKIREMAVKLHAAFLSFYLNTDPLYKVEPLITDTAGEFKFCPL
jgi:hypothetical protein